MPRRGVTSLRSRGQTIRGGYDPLLRSVADVARRAAYQHEPAITLAGFERIEGAEYAQSWLVWTACSG